eukprot:1385943-Amorphochlora_amoeboformis.AAC.1
MAYRRNRFEKNSEMVKRKDLRADIREEIRGQEESERERIIKREKGGKQLKETIWKNRPR